MREERVRNTPGYSASRASLHTQCRSFVLSCRCIKPKLLLAAFFPQLTRVSAPFVHARGIFFQLFLFFHHLWTFRNIRFDLDCDLTSIFSLLSTSSILSATRIYIIEILFKHNTGYFLITKLVVVTYFRHGLQDKRWNIDRYATQRHLSAPLSSSINSIDDN